MNSNTRLNVGQPSHAKVDIGDIVEIAVPIIEAAKRAGVGRSTIYEAVNRGELRLKKSGRRSLVLVDDLKAWVNALPNASTPKLAA